MISRAEFRAMRSATALIVMLAAACLVKCCASVAATTTMTAFDARVARHVAAMAMGDRR